MQRSKRLARLASLYEMIEQMRSMELRIAAAAVAEVDRATSMQLASQQRQKEQARAALGAGDREQWQTAETTRSLVETRIDQLKLLRQKRVQIEDEAAAAHRASHLRMEQMDRVVEHGREQQAMEASRREQAEADDRYASRRAWNMGRANTSSE